MRLSPSLRLTSDLNLDMELGTNTIWLPEISRVTSDWQKARFDTKLGSSLWILLLAKISSCRGRQVSSLGRLVMLFPERSRTDKLFSLNILVSTRLRLISVARSSLRVWGKFVVIG